MRNWSVDIKELKKDRNKYAVWRLEQQVNFGLGGKKIDKLQLKKYWPRLNLDAKKKRFLSLLLWPSKLF